MDLKGILSISGKGGLFKLVSQTRNGIIVESLQDGERMPAYATSKISSLEDIAIYTYSGDIPFVEVLKNIYNKENGNPAISHKAPAEELKSYFKEVLPDYDQERVYVSDIKRIISWYNQLQECKLLNFDKPEDTITENETEPEPEQNESLIETELDTETTPSDQKTEL